MNTNEYADTLKATALMLEAGDKESAGRIIVNNYPFVQLPDTGRQPRSVAELLQIHLQDGFIDRYTGQKLINPGLLRTFSVLLNDVFPFQEHWKMSECHMAYWDFCPTIDHVIPLARGGKDGGENIVTTTMLTNSKKSNWTLEELGWELLDKGDLEEWDGLATCFMRIYDANEQVQNVGYIKKWYNASKMLYSAR